jgi:hypothetical protein
MTKLVFSRQFNEAHGETHVYRLHRAHRYGCGGRGWCLTIFTPDRFGSIMGDEARIVVMDDPHDTRALAAAKAQAYENLGDDYSQADHGGKARLTQATLDAYAADKAA